MTYSHLFIWLRLKMTRPDFNAIVIKLDDDLFKSITGNPSHCLYLLLPPLQITRTLQSQKKGT